eukprot:gene2241-2454_t
MKQDNGFIIFLILFANVAFLFFSNLLWWESLFYSLSTAALWAMSCSPYSPLRPLFGGLESVWGRLRRWIRISLIVMMLVLAVMTWSMRLVVVGLFTYRGLLFILSDPSSSRKQAVMMTMKEWDEHRSERELADVKARKSASHHKLAAKQQTQNIPPPPSPPLPSSNTSSASTKLHPSPKVPTNEQSQPSQSSFSAFLNTRGRRGSSKKGISSSNSAVIDLTVENDDLLANPPQTSAASVTIIEADVPKSVEPTKLPLQNPSPLDTRKETSQGRSDLIDEVQEVATETLHVNYSLVVPPTPSNTNEFPSQKKRQLEDLYDSLEKREQEDGLEGVMVVADDSQRRKVSWRDSEISLPILPLSKRKDSSYQTPSKSVLKRKKADRSSADSHILAEMEQMHKRQKSLALRSKLHDGINEVEESPKSFVAQLQARSKALNSAVIGSSKNSEDKLSQQSSTTASTPSTESNSLAQSTSDSLLTFNGFSSVAQTKEVLSSSTFSFGGGTTAPTNGSTQNGQNSAGIVSGITESRSAEFSAPKATTKTAESDGISFSLPQSSSASTLSSNGSGSGKPPPSPFAASHKPKTTEIPFGIAFGAKQTETSSLAATKEDENTSKSKHVTFNLPTTATPTTAAADSSAPSTFSFGAPPSASSTMPTAAAATTNSASTSSAPPSFTFGGGNSASTAPAMSFGGPTTTAATSSSTASTTPATAPSSSSFAFGTSSNSSNIGTGGNPSLGFGGSIGNNASTSTFGTSLSTTASTSSTAAAPGSGPFGSSPSIPSSSTTFGSSSSSSSTATTPAFGSGALGSASSGNQQNSLSTTPAPFTFGGVNTGVSQSSAPQSTSAFGGGGTATTSTFSFGSAAPASGSAPAFGGTSSTTNAAAAPAFGAPTPFGGMSTITNSTSAPAFGASAPFGGTVAPTPTSASGTSTPAFGVMNNTTNGAAAPAFGASTSFGGPTPTSANTPFGGSAPPFGGSAAPASGSAPAFGGTSSTTNAAVAPAFGAPTPFGGMSTITNSASAPAFGASAPFGGTVSAATPTPTSRVPTSTFAFGAGSSAPFGSVSSSAPDNSMLTLNPFGGGMGGLSGGVGGGAGGSMFQLGSREGNSSSRRKVKVKK